MSDARVPCRLCGAAVVCGARKCRVCKGWIVDKPAAGARGEPRMPRAALIVASAVATVMAVIVTSRESPVGEAPPLTPVGTASASGPRAPAPAAIGPEVEPEPPPPPMDPTRRWKGREIRVGEVHPLDIAWNPKGASIYVSADDATLREYTVKNGELIHQASMPAQGDHIRLLYDRFVAVLRHRDAARIPVMDTTAWDRDPVLLELGRSPGDIVQLPDGKSVVAATTDGKRVGRFELPSGARLADITLPHATGQLFVVQAGGRSYVAAMGALTHAGRPSGAWLDLFDPAETPFGATRRSISVGREPGAGAVTWDGGALFFADRRTNTATLLRVSGTTEAKAAAVGQGPEAAFLMNGDRYGVTIDRGSRTASVVELATMKVASTLMLGGEPCSGDTSPDGRTLFVSLGGSGTPPRGSGLVVIAGEPPKVVATVATGDGACAVAVSKDGTRAAVASWIDRSITVIQQ